MHDRNKSLRLLRHLMSAWAGETVGDSGLARILNHQGKRTPLIWCFNDQYSFEIMAADLGPDQPVIGLRSLHLVERIGPARYRHDQIAAEIYMEALLPHMELNECTIGGNCQGATIAAHMTSALLQMGKRPRALISMEAEPLVPVPVQVGLIFGDRSEMFNPFLRGETPQEKWRTMFLRPTWEIIPGAHGEYFDEENHRALGMAVAKIIDVGTADHPATPTEHNVSVDTIEPLSPMRAGERSSLRIQHTTEPRQTAGDIAPIVVYLLWISAEHGPSDVTEIHPLAISPSGGTETTSLVARAPAQPGEWTLHAFPCRKDSGPLSWHLNAARTWRIQVAGDSA